MSTLLSFNWEFQSIARRMAADLRRAGVEVHHSLDGTAMPSTPYSTVIALLSKSYEESPAARREIIRAMNERTKAITVVMENLYEPEDWLVRAFQNCPRLYLLNEEQYSACLMRLRVEMPQSSVPDRLASMPVLEALSLSGHEVWEEVEGNFVVPPHSENTAFLYVNVRCQFDIQQIALASDDGPTVKNVPETLLTRVFNTFCIFDDEIDISMCQLFEGPNNSTFMCLRGDAAMVDTVISEGLHFFASDPTLSGKLGGLLRYQEFRDLIFCTRGPRLSPPTVESHDQFEVVLCSVQGRAIKSPPIAVARDSSVGDMLEHIRGWLKLSASAQEPTMLTWNPEGGVFRKVVGSLRNYWSFADEVEPHVFSLEVLVETSTNPEEDGPVTALAIKTATPPMWFRLTSLMDYVAFTVSTCKPVAESGVVIQGDATNLGKIKAAHEKGALTDLLQVPLELVQMGAVPRPASAETAASAESVDDAHALPSPEYEEDEPLQRSDISVLEMSQRLRANIRAIEGNLGYIRPTVNRNATFSEASADMRRNFILKGVKGVQGTLKKKMRIEPVVLESSLLRDRTRSGSWGPTRSSSLRGLETASADGAADGDVAVGSYGQLAASDDQRYKLQLNRLVKRLKSSRNYQSFKSTRRDVASPVSAIPAPPPPENSPASSPKLRRTMFEFPGPDGAVAAAAAAPASRAVAPDLTTTTEKQLLLGSVAPEASVDTRANSDSHDKGDVFSDELPSFWRTSGFIDKVGQQTQAKFAELDAQGTGRVAMRTVREHMTSVAGFAEDEVSALLAGVKVGLEGSGLLTYEEFHSLCIHALLGASARELHLRDSYALFDNTEA